jgi:hypothetical protein
LGERGIKNWRAALTRWARYWLKECYSAEAEKNICFLPEAWEKEVEGVLPKPERRQCQ